MSPVNLLSDFPPHLRPVVNRCWEKAHPPAEWHLSFQQFEEALGASVAHRFPDAVVNSENPDSRNARAIQAYLESLHVADPFTSRARAAPEVRQPGIFSWRNFRPELYRAARAIAGEAGARELADSLYAELYGLRESAGQRKSLFDYFHGRSKLGTWLRAILAQRHVDGIRSHAKGWSLSTRVRRRTAPRNAGACFQGCGSRSRARKNISPCCKPL